MQIHKFNFKYVITDPCRRGCMMSKTYEKTIISQVNRSTDLAITEDTISKAMTIWMLMKLFIGLSALK